MEVLLTKKKYAPMSEEPLPGPAPRLWGVRILQHSQHDALLTIPLDHKIMESMTAGSQQWPVVSDCQRSFEVHP